MRVIEIRKTCYACPAQWEGMVEGGKHLYIRYRWGWLSVDIGEDEVLAKQYGDAMNGYMDGAELKALTKELLDFGDLDLGDGYNYE